MRSFSIYLNILGKKGISYCLRETWKKIQRLHFIKDERLLALQHEHNAYNYLLRYTSVLDLPYQKAETTLNPYPNKIWIAWLQGEDQAPALVKKCIASIKKYSAGREVIILTEENIKNYITFPDYIQDKKKKNIISNTHFSDLIRICLLAEYGGIWVDATVYLTEPIPDYILNAPLFCYKSSHLSPGKIKASSWFIATQPYQEIIVRTRDLLFAYWKKEYHLNHYFTFHLFFTIVIDTLPHLTEEWKHVPYYNNVNPHILLFELPNPFDEERFQQIKGVSPIHKLTWKISQEDSVKQDTFLQKILNS